MYKQPKIRTRAVRFLRFCRGKWAAFRSMHREVTIGQLSVRVADHQLRKSAAAVLLCLVAPQTATIAQADADRETRTLPEVTIALTTDSLFGSSEPAAVIAASDLQHLSVNSLSDLLAQLPGLDVRMRGPHDVQGDLSMRGGTFDQMVLMLNGINITDAQTGHHNLDIPIDLAMVQRVELLSPAQMMARGIVAFCGGVNIVVADEYRDRLIASLSGGSFAMANLSLLATKVLGGWAVTASASYHRSDGYQENTDYRYASLFLQAMHHSEHNDWHIQLGGQTKDFGSHAFYSSSYPDQFEATRTLTASILNLHRWHSLCLETALYGRLHRDRFELFRDGYVAAPDWYSGHNHHLSYLAGVRSRLLIPFHIGQALVGVDLRREGIWSNVLGEPSSQVANPYNKQAARSNLNLFAGYELAYRHLSAEATLLGNYNSRFGLDYGLSLHVAYRCTSNWRLFAQASRTFRHPTFTDLYYQSVNQRANPDLGSERSLCFEAGSIWRTNTSQLSSSVYYRSGHQIIDWVRWPDDEVWYSMNHTAVDALGTELSGLTHINLFHLPASIGATYSFCHIVQDAGSMISGSALDYMRHHLRLDFALHPTAKFTFKINPSYRYREGQYVDAEGNAQQYGGVLLWAASAEYRFSTCTIFLEAYNLTNRTYRDHGGVVQPGISALAGLRLAL